jgi:hypothetical protein
MVRDNLRCETRAGILRIRLSVQPSQSIRICAVRDGECIFAPIVVHPPGGHTIRTARFMTTRRQFLIGAPVGIAGALVASRSVADGDGARIVQRQSDLSDLDAYPPTRRV